MNAILKLNNYRVKVGDVFSRLTVLELIADRKNPKAKCICECGNLTISQRGALKNGKAKSCGCLKKELLKKHIDSIRGTGKSKEEILKRVRINSRKWALSNHDKRKLITKKYYQAHVEKLKNYREKNRENKKAYDAEYFALNKDKLAPSRRLQDHNRRIREINLRCKVSKNIVAKLMVLQKCKCAICKCDLNSKNYELDHIEPLAKGGMHDDSNFQLLCQFCNRSKGAKDPIIYMQSKGFLL